MRAASEDERSAVNQPELEPFPSRHFLKHFTPGRSLRPRRPPFIRFEGIMGFLYRCLSVFVLFTASSIAQSVPPLQWIRVKTTGTTASPALAYAAAGYDALNNQLVIFGGETAGGLLEGNTHLLNLDSLTWTSPSTSTPQNPALKPPARSHSSYGHDIIASYRNGLIVYGGKGQQGALSDVWEYAFNGQFWYNLTVRGDIPSPRFGAVGGGDPPSVDNSASDLLTTFWLTGGANTANDGSYQPVEYDNIYRLQIGGTIAQNYKDATATWTRFANPSASRLNPRLAQAGMVMRTTEGSAKLGLYGGCEGDSASHATVSCAQQDAHVLSTSDSNPVWSSISKCPSARIGAVLVPTLNHLFGDMAFLVLGISPNSNTTDAARLNKRGEVDVLSLSQGTWIRVLPSCDPLSDPPCPVPREGAAVVSSSTSMVGSLGGGGVASDMIVFGGKDANGNVLNDVWILRATTAQITSTNQTDWGPLYDDGILGSGVDTNGRGVTVEYVTECASATAPGTTSTANVPQQTVPNGPSNPNARDRLEYTTSTAHKALAAVSVPVILAAVLFSRWSRQSSDQHRQNTTGSLDVTSIRLLILVAAAAWAAGVAGFATSFTSIKRNSAPKTNLQRRDTGTGPGFVATPHAVVGCILFALTYVVAPLVLIIRHRSIGGKGSRKEHTSVDSIDEETSTPALTSHRSDEVLTNISMQTEKSPMRGKVNRESQEEPRTEGKISVDEDDVDPIGAGERTKLKSRPLSVPSAFLRHQLLDSGWSSKRNQPRQRVQSSSTITTTTPPSPSASQPPTETGFVVLNRGRQALDRMSHLQPDQRQHPITLNDVSWLERRRNMNMVSDMDYVMSQMPVSHRRHSHSPLITPRSGDAETLRTNSQTPNNQIAQSGLSGFPKMSAILLHCAFQAMILALCVFTASSIFTKADKKYGIPLGSVFVVIVGIFYGLMILLAVRGIPEGSILVEVVRRLSGSPSHGNFAEHIQSNGNELNVVMPHENRSVSERPQSIAVDSTTLGSLQMSRPLYHSTRYSTEGKDSNAQRDDEDDEAERIEREMGRRDVSIVTVPKRRLFIANSDPS